MATSAHSESADATLTQYGPNRGYCMVTVRPNDAYNRLVDSVDRKWLCKDSNGVLPRDGALVTRTDDCCGPHYTLQARVLTEFITDQMKSLPVASMGDEWRRIYDELVRVYTASNKQPCIRPISDIDTCVALQPFTFKTGPTEAEPEGYVCMGYKVQVGDNVKNIRKFLHEHFPDFNGFPTWQPHVTLGYFLPQYEEDVRKLLTESLDKVEFTAEKLVFSVKPDIAD